MTIRLRFLAVTFAFTIPFASPTTAQNVVDFREAIRIAEPALLTVTVAPDDQDAEAIQPVIENNDQPRNGPRIEFFNLEGQALKPFVNGQQRILANVRASEMTSAAFAVEESMLIALVGSGVKQVQVTNRHGEVSDGTVVALDHVTGLAAIKVDQSLESTLVVSAAQTEPGMPVVAAWFDDVLKSDAGMVSTRAIATGSGIGLSPEIDFGSGKQLVGAPVLDSDGIVVGALVPSKNGGLVLARASDILRLIDAASGENARDLKRGLVGIQFEGGGPLVLQVRPESGAASAGVQAGDLIKRVGDFAVRDAEDVVAAVSSGRAGDTLEILVLRGDETLTIPVELGEHPQQRTTMISPNGGSFEMEQAFELKDGKLVPMDIDPGFRGLPPGFRRFPMQEMFKDLQGPNSPVWRVPIPRGDVEGFQIERSEVEKTLKELQRQMEQLNKKFDDRD